MALKTFTSDPMLASSFVRFAEDLYAGDRNWIPPFRDEQLRDIMTCGFATSQPGGAYRHFLATVDETVVGRLSVFINPNLRDGQGRRVATVGNFECIHDRFVAEDLLGSAADWIRRNSDCTVIWGPMNYDIWHGYRMMTRGFDRTPFCSEPYNKPYYPDMFGENRYRVLQTWNSVEINGREEITRAIGRGRSRYERVVSAGYRFLPFGQERFERDLINLYDLVNRSFSCFLGYTPTRFAEFRKIFNPNRAAIDPSVFVLVRDEKEAICGFAGSFVDVSEGVRSMRGTNSAAGRLRFMARRALSRRLIFYLGGVTPEEADKHAGLGRAAFYHVLHRALQRGYSSVVVALMAQGNVVRGVLDGRGARADREYALFEHPLAA